MNIARPYSFSSGKSCFQSNRESISAGDYILKKSGANLLATNNSCSKSKRNLCLGKFYQGKNLNLNLFTKLDLVNACTIKLNNPQTCPTQVDPGKIFSLNYTIDPNGDLFGNNVCGAYRFQQYLVPNLPNKYYELK